MDPENGQLPADALTWVLHFPVKAPKSAIIQEGMTTEDYIGHYQLLTNHYTTHNVSATIPYEDHTIGAGGGIMEILGQILRMVRHQGRVGTGFTVLPRSTDFYEQMPYEAITEEEYKVQIAAFPHIDFSKLFRYEEGDYTTVASELACTGKGCELL